MRLRLVRGEWKYKTPEEREGPRYPEEQQGQYGTQKREGQELSVPFNRDHDNGGSSNNGRPCEQLIAGRDLAAGIPGQVALGPPTQGESAPNHHEGPADDAESLKHL